MAYRAHIFLQKITKNYRALFMPYVGLKFTIAEISYLATPISFDFRVIFIYLSLFKRLLFQLKVLS